MNQSIHHTYQENRTQQPLQIQTPTLASPTNVSGSKSLPATPRNRDLTPIHQPDFNLTPTRGQHSTKFIFYGSKFILLSIKDGNTTTA